MLNKLVSILKIVLVLSMIEEGFVAMILADSVAPVKLKMTLDVKL